MRVGCSECHRWVCSTKARAYVNVEALQAAHPAVLRFSVKGAAMFISASDNDGFVMRKTRLTSGTRTTKLRIDHAGQQHYYLQPGDVLSERSDGSDLSLEVLILAQRVPSFCAPLNKPVYLVPACSLPLVLGIARLSDERRKMLLYDGSAECVDFLASLALK